VIPKKIEKKNNKKGEEEEGREQKAETWKEGEIERNWKIVR